MPIFTIDKNIFTSLHSSIMNEGLTQAFEPSKQISFDKYVTLNPETMHDAIDKTHKTAIMNKHLKPTQVHSI